MTLLSEYLIETFGCKVYKVALNGGFTCPNRDGTIDTRGCIFCSAGGSGEFAEDAGLSITEQIEKGKRRVASKVKDGRYIAYFQAYTGTYAPIEKLKKLYTEAIRHPDVVAISIATRPDCISDEVLDLLSELNAIKPVWVELGLQTVHDRTAEYIRRGYGLDVYNKAVRDLYRRNIEVITHVILGLPGESVDDMLETVRYVCDLGREMTGRRKSKSGPEMKSDVDDEQDPKMTDDVCDEQDTEITGDVCVKHGPEISDGVNATPCQQMFGIKLQLLHVLNGTDLENEYNTGRFKVLTEDEYIEILKQCVRIIPNEVVIHRLTGDGDKRILVAPLWSGDKKHVWNRIQREVFAEKI